MTKPIIRRPRVTAAERTAWALERVLEAVDRLARDKHSPALLEATLARRVEHRALQAIAAREANGEAIRAGHHRRNSRLAQRPSPSVL